MTGARIAVERCGQAGCGKPPRRAAPNMVGNRNARRIKAMNAPLKAVANTGALEAAMLEIGRARPCRRACARPCRAGAQKPRARRHGGGDPRLARGDPGRQCGGCRGGQIRGRRRGLSRSPDARRPARRGDGGRHRRRAQAQGSGRDGLDLLAAPQRHAHRARARPARRRRRDLRKPAERDRRRRRVMPEGRQRRDPARRLRQFPLDQALSMPPWSKDWPKQTCRPPPSRWCRRASAPPWA